jgi:hypothetical protein
MFQTWLRPIMTYYYYYYILLILKMGVAIANFFDFKELVVVPN